jgi:hypothetical protein
VRTRYWVAICIGILAAIITSDHFINKAKVQTEQEFVPSVDNGAKVPLPAGLRSVGVEVVRIRSNDTTCYILVQQNNVKSISCL